MFKYAICINIVYHIFDRFIFIIFYVRVLDVFAVTVTAQDCSVIVSIIMSVKYNMNWVRILSNSKYSKYNGIRNGPVPEHGPGHRVRLRPQDDIHQQRALTQASGCNQPSIISNIHALSRCLYSCQSIAPYSLHCHGLLQNMCACAVLMQ